MIIIVGAIIVLASVSGSFMWSGSRIPVPLHLNESMPLVPRNLNPNQTLETPPPSISGAADARPLSGTASRLNSVLNLRAPTGAAATPRSHE